ncbi:MAG: hypothetical protein NZ822_00420 [Patescibacteria group bacterium]|nr:hypothetical protein [Patescibacteria group bacterium]
MNSRLFLLTILLFLLAFSFFVRAQGSQESNQGLLARAISFFDQYGFLISPAIWSTYKVTSVLANPQDFIIGLVAQIVEIIAFILKYVGWFLHALIMYVNLNLLGPFADRVLALNPFDTIPGKSPPAEILWSILKTFSYVILVFSALAAGFQWILGEDNSAKSLIFTIIIVALFIDFTYLFIKEAFYIVRAIENGISGEVEVRRPDGTVENVPAVAALGSLIASASWSKGEKDTVNVLNEINRLVDDSSLSANQMSNKIGQPTTKLEPENIEALRKSFVAIGVSLFYVGFAMIIFVSLVVLSAIALARYLILTFLVAVSSFAVATLAFPKFKPPFGALTSMVSNTFDNWLKYVSSWLLVVPVFGIMMVLGIILRNNFFASTPNVNNLTATMQFIVSLTIILGWFLISLITAVRMSGKIGDIAQKFGIGALAWTGMKMASLTAKPLRGKIASGLEKVGGFLGRRAGLGWWGRRMYRMSQMMQKTSEGMKKVAYGEKAETAGFMLKDAYERIEKARTSEERERATRNLVSVLQQINREPEVAKMVKENIKTSGYALDAISENRDAFREYLSVVSRMDAEIQEGIFSRLSKDTGRRVLQYMADRDYANAIANLSPIAVNALANRIRDIDADDAIELLENDNLRNNLVANPNLEPIRRSMNRATRGLYEALLTENIQEAANRAVEALSSLPSEVFRRSGSLNQLLSSKFADEDRQRIWSQALERNAENISRGIRLASEQQRALIRGELNRIFNAQPNLLGRFSDQEIRNLMSIIDENILDAALTDEQKRRLGMPRSIIESISQDLNQLRNYLSEISQRSAQVQARAFSRLSEEAITRLLQSMINAEYARLISNLDQTAINAFAEAVRRLSPQSASSLEANYALINNLNTYNLTQIRDALSEAARGGGPTIITARG